MQHGLLRSQPITRTLSLTSPGTSVRPSSRLGICHKGRQLVDEICLNGMELNQQLQREKEINRNEDCDTVLLAGSLPSVHTQGD